MRIESDTIELVKWGAPSNGSRWSIAINDTVQNFRDDAQVEDGIKATIFGALWQGGWSPVDAIEEANLKITKAKDRHFQAYS